MGLYSQIWLRSAYGHMNWPNNSWVSSKQVDLMKKRKELYLPANSEGVGSASWKRKELQLEAINQTVEHVLAHCKLLQSLSALSGPAPWFAVNTEGYRVVLWGHRCSLTQVDPDSSYFGLAQRLHQANEGTSLGTPVFSLNPLRVMWVWSKKHCLSKEILAVLLL